LLACLVLNIIWPSLMILVIICGLFRLNSNLITSPLCPIFLPYVATKFSSTIKVIQCNNGREFDNLTTWTFLSSHGTHSYGCCVPTCPLKMVKSSVPFILLTMSFACFLARLPFSGAIGWSGLHTATYLLNHLPTMTICASCPHVALFRSAPLYEHRCVFGCACYPNTTALSTQSSRCVFLGYSFDNKGYRCHDLSTNCLIVSHHVVFDEDTFPLAATPHLTNLDFLCESGAPDFHHWDPISPKGSPTMPACQPAPVIPPRFEPQEAPMLALLPKPRVPPRTASTPRAGSLIVHASSPTATYL
jgi:hypothetical protein